jgi:hypothetical protein
MTTPQVPTNMLDYATARAADIITTVFDWGVPSVRTDAEDDAPGSTAYIAASGFRVGSNINFTIEVIDPETHAHLWTGPVWDVANGSPTDGEDCADRTVLTQFSGTRDYADTTIRLKALDRATGQTATTIFIDSNGSLSDWQDGPAPSGNFSGSKPHYAEGESVPFEVVFTSLTTETTYSITHTWDTTKAGLHASDYSWATSHPQEPTQFPDPVGTSLFAASTVTACDPNGGGVAGGPMTSTLTIPVDPVLAKATPTAQASGQVVGLASGVVTGPATRQTGAIRSVAIGDGDHGTTSGTLAVGETWTFAATHTVTSAEIDVAR